MSATQLRILRPGMTKRCDQQHNVVARMYNQTSMMLCGWNVRALNGMM